MSTPTRLESHWEEISVRFKERWPLLCQTDLEQISGNYDKLITTLKRIYGRGKSIILEADIRDQVNEIIHQVDG